MSLSITDAKIFGQAIKKARKKLRLTQEACAEMLNLSLSYYKDLERGRSVPALGSYYNICRIMNLSADECIFFESAPKDDEAYQALLHLLSRCNEYSLSVLTATALALIENQTKDPSDT